MQKNKIRKPAVAGLFYPADKGELVKMINNLVEGESSNFDFSYCRHKIIGGIVPHAGYVYSGHHAVHFFKILQESNQPIDTIVILNPNHRGIGPDIALDSHSIWVTPLGATNIDKAFCKALDIELSSIAHEAEHSGEVIVPFINHFLPNKIKIAPISMFDQSYESAVVLAKKINKASSLTGKKIIVIASSDFSHYVTPDEGYKLDNLVCEKIEKLDAKGVREVITNNNISVCGYGPIMTLIEYAKIKHSKPRTHILSRGHSGEISPSTRVVDYITTLFFENVK